MVPTVMMMRSSSIGVIGAGAERAVVFMSIELMLNAVNSPWLASRQSTDTRRGRCSSFVLVVAAAEVAVDWRSSPSSRHRDSLDLIEELAEGVRSRP